MINILAIRLIPILSLSMILNACGGGTSGSGSGTLNLNITDAPVVGALNVVVAFSGVTVKPSEGAAFDIDFVDETTGDPLIKSIDLLDQQGEKSEPLLVNQTLDAGHYNWLRLKVVANATSAETGTDSHIVMPSGMHPLYIPSGDQTGLKLNQGFDITDGGAVTLTIDFDLEKSVVAPNNLSGAYKLRPSLRIVNNTEIGHIIGTVGTVPNPCVNGAVYVFNGNNATPDDIDGDKGDPITKSLLSDTNGYVVGFLNAGDYTLAFTCDADDPEVDEVVNFIDTVNVTVVSGTTTVPVPDFL